MWTSFLVAMGGVLAIGLIGFVVAWQAGKAATGRIRTGADQLELSLDRMERELHRVREIARSVR